MSNSRSKISSISGGNNQRYAVRTFAIAGDGQVIAVGQDLNSNNLNRGPIYIYKITRNNNWAQVGTGLSGDEQSRFGSSISLSKDGMILVKFIHYIKSIITNHFSKSKLKPSFLCSSISFLTI